jgi:hypothetical protein
MHSTATFSYASGAGYQAVQLPYANSTLSALVVLPDMGTDPMSLLSRVSLIESGSCTQGARADQVCPEAYRERLRWYGSKRVLHPMDRQQ